MADVAYLDSSALVKLVIEEPESWALADYIRNRSTVSSDIARVELPRSVRRMGLMDVARERTTEVLRSLTLLKLERVALVRACEVERGSLRCLDAIHLASALSIPELDAFITYDRRLGNAAASNGLPTIAPA